MSAPGMFLIYFDYSNLNFCGIRNGTQVAIKTIRNDNVDNEEFETEVSLLKSLR